jgi:hypothetical protein
MGGMTQDQYIALFSLSLILLPIAVLTWRENKSRFLKHLLVWGVIILFVVALVQLFKPQPRPEAPDYPPDGQPAKTVPL